MKSKTKASNGKYERFKSSRLYDLMYEKGVLYFVLAFIIPFVIMIIGFQKVDIYMMRYTDGSFQRTGEKQFLVVDLWHQYYPFFKVVREKLMTGGSFLYSWRNGLGTNFLALIAYYAMSPLNWLSVFSDNDGTKECLMYILAAKIGFCGAFSTCFLRYTFKRKDISIVAFSVMFALCAYTCGYYWNVMWFDTIAMFPLVMTGVVAICREKKWILYTITLCLSLVFNYYVGLFTCIFTIFMFASFAIIEWKSFKDTLLKLWMIARSSVIAIAMGAFILLPTYIELKLTYSANNTFPKELKWAEKWQDIFSNLLSFTPPTTKEGLPNLACGMLAVALIGVFLFSKGIKIREKITAFLALALILVSVNDNQLNYIWHGFHITNMIPYRYSYIFSFILVVAAYRAYHIMTEKGIKYYQLPLLAVGPAFLLLEKYFSVRETEAGFTFSDKAVSGSLYIVGSYMLIFCFVKIVGMKSKGMKALLNTAICIAVVVEMSQNAFLGIKTVGTSDRKTYPSYNDDVQAVLDVMRIRENDEFCRSEITSNFTLNDSALYGYYGVSQFASSANVSVTRFCNRLGIYGYEAANRYFYRTATPIVNELLGVDYVISKLSPLKNSSAFTEHITAVNNTNLYENKYRLSMGFMMNEDILDMEDSGGSNPFEYQNMIMKKAAGVNDAVYTAQPVALVSYDGMEADKTSYGEYNFSLTADPSDAHVRYDYAGVDGAYLYGYVKGTNIKNVSVECDGESVDGTVEVGPNSISFPLGDGTAGSTSSVKFSFKDDTRSGSYTMVAYALGVEAFEKAYELLADEQLDITEFGDTRIKGNIKALNGGVLYMAMPYEKGWTAYVDGEKAETVPVLNAMLGVKMPAGDHEVVLTYSPEGFSTGLWVGFGAFLIFIALAALEKRKSKKAPARIVVESSKTVTEKIADNKEDAKEAEQSSEDKTEEKKDDKKTSPAKENKPAAKKPVSKGNKKGKKKK